MDRIRWHRDCGRDSLLGTPAGNTRRFEPDQRRIFQSERVRQHSFAAHICRGHFNKVKDFSLALAMILPPEKTHFYQLHAFDRWNELYKLTAFDIFILIPYLAILTILAIYGIHRYHLVYLYLKHKDKVAHPKAKLETKPRVTIQLPIYNEMYVVERLVEAACNVRYPRELRDIQVRDDATDGTVERGAG